MFNIYTNINAHGKVIKRRRNIIRLQKSLIKPDMVATKTYTLSLFIRHHVLFTNVQYET